MIEDTLAQLATLKTEPSILDSLQTISVFANHHREHPTIFVPILTLLQSPLATAPIIHLCCLILDTLTLTNIDPALVEMALKSSNENVVLSTLKAVRKVKVNPNIDLIVGLLASSESISTLAKDILEQTFAEIGDKAAFVRSLTPGLLKLVSEHSNVVCIRAYELTLNLSCRDRSLFEGTGLLDFATTFADHGDILSTLNVIELFIQLSKTESAYAFLKMTDVLAEMKKLMHSEEVFLQSSAVKFWGQFCFHQASHLTEVEREFTIFECLSALYESDDLEMRDTVMIAVGNISSTSVGLTALAEEQTLLSRITKSMYNSTGALKLSSLRTLSCLMSHSNSTADQSALSLKIFTDFGSNPLEKVLNLSQSSIEEMSIAALSTIKGVLSFDWGLEMLSNLPGLVSSLLERKKETPDTIKEWKYSVVQTIALNPKAKTALAATAFKRFEEFSKEGPWKTEYAPVVAFESG